MSQRSSNNTQFIEGKGSTSTINSVDELGPNFHPNRANGNYLITLTSANTENLYANPQYSSYHATSHHGFVSQNVPPYSPLNHGLVHTYSNTTHPTGTSSSSEHKKKSSI